MAKEKKFIVHIEVYRGQPLCGADPEWNQLAFCLDYFHLETNKMQESPFSKLTWGCGECAVLLSNIARVFAENSEDANHPEFETAMKPQCDRPNPSDFTHPDLNSLRREGEARRIGDWTGL